MSSKHTPGPWRARRSQFGGSAWVVYGGTDGATPIAMTISNASPLGMAMARRGEIEANAHLLGAALQLREALQELVRLEADGKHANESAIEVWERARAALAAAGGAQQ